MIRLVGFTGRAGTGKSTAAYMLVKNVSEGKPRLDFFVRQFATPIKRMTVSLLTCVWHKQQTRATEATIGREAKERPIAELGGITPREIMQTLGTEWGRSVMGKDFWITVEIANLERIFKEVKRTRGYVYDDLRFQNEADMIRQLGGIVVGIRGRETDTKSTVHASETNLPEPDYWIDNSGDLEHLQEQVDKLADICRQSADK